MPTVLPSENEHAIESSHRYNEIMNIARFALISFCASLSSLALAQIDIGTTDSSDGNISWVNTNVDLSLAAPTLWSNPSPVPGRGVYDSQKWAVVYKVNDLTIHNVTFLPHPSGCPVVILAQGNVTVSNNAAVSAQVGGFRGGLPSNVGPGAAGIGLGGGSVSTDTSRNPGGGSYATAAFGGATPFPPGDVYGNPAIIPLVGGSGGGAYFGAGGGHGGGAILIACRNTISLQATLFALGESSSNGAPGSGGGIRLVANTVTGNSNGSLQATPGGGANGMTGGQGRNRIEANTFGSWGIAFPTASLATVGTTAKIWPLTTDPTVKLLSVNGINVPAEPGTPFNSPDIDLTAAGSYTVLVEARNVPIDGTWSVSVRGVPKSGSASIYNCTVQGGSNQALSTWAATIPFTDGLQVIQARAKKN